MRVSPCASQAQYMVLVACLLLKSMGAGGRAGAGVYSSLGKWALAPDSVVSYSGLGPSSPCVGDLLDYASPEDLACRGCI